MGVAIASTFLQHRYRILIATILVVWVITMLSLPIVLWTAGQTALQQGIVVAVLIQVCTVLSILLPSWGLRATIRTVLIVAGLSWLAEVWGSNTGFPFGAYHYTNALQSKLAGVPLLIPLAWLMMLPPAWAIASLITHHEKEQVRFVSRSWLVFAAVSALAFTAWDLYLDPQMVHWQFWVWQERGIYFGIPLQNFMGWLAVSGLITWIVRPSRLPTHPLFVVYTITWLLQFTGQLLFWGLPGPAFAGFLGMGLMLLWAYVRSRRQPDTPFSLLRNMVSRRRINRLQPSTKPG